MWIRPRQPASCGGFINLSSPVRCLHRHCVKRPRHYERIQRLPIPITGQRFNCSVTSNSLTERRTSMSMGHMESTPVKQLKLPGSPGKLNVILHGLFDFDQEKDKEEIAVYIPNV